MPAPELPDHIKQTLSELRGTNDLRAWSVIVTIMGDLAMKGGSSSAEGACSGATLTGLMSVLGIKPEATRVALHRLRKDRWITSTRTGRGAVHRLTEKGRIETISAAKQIYGPSPETSGIWTLVIVPPQLACTDRDARLLDQGFALIGRGVFLGEQLPKDAERDSFLISRDRDLDIPDWVLSSLIPEHVATDAQRLEHALSSISPKMADALPPTIRAALRVAILHQWRRIVLRLVPAFAEHQMKPLGLRSRVHIALEVLAPKEPLEVDEK